ncbi:glycosyltransferase family 4 protein [Runella sp.]|uniref:glycosyltransferase family 4 protein n=1 Tax=Runella sp. TaxID=1960881 RepID=UPI003D1054CE
MNNLQVNSSKDLSLIIADFERKIGIIGHGDDQWVAGVQYIQSLIIGRFLLQHKENTLLFLHRDFHNPNDYNNVKDFVHQVQTFNLFYGSSYPLLKKWLAAGKRLLKNQKPLFPENNLPSMLECEEIDIIFPANGLLSRKYSQAKRICWIPDFQQLHFPEYFGFTEKILRYRAFRKMVKLADKIILSNRVSYEDACRMAPSSAHKFEIMPFTMYLGSNWRIIDNDQICRKYDVPEDYLMFPSQFWKHKNHMTLFLAILLLKRRGLKINLVCTGLFYDPRFPNYCKELQSFVNKHELKSQIWILGLLPRIDQVQLMRKARAIVQPSLYEGWSALLEDCRGLGKVVFVSDIVMHREQQPDNAIFFDPGKPEQLADLIDDHWQQIVPSIGTVHEQKGEQLNLDGLKRFAQKFSDICNTLP